MESNEFRPKIVGYSSIKGLSHDKGVNEDRYIMHNPVKISVKKKLEEIIPIIQQEKEISNPNNKEEEVISNNTSASTPTSPNIELDVPIITLVEDIKITGNIVNENAVKGEENIVVHVNKKVTIVKKNNNNIPPVQNPTGGNNNKKNKKNKKKSGNSNANQQTNQIISGQNQQKQSNPSTNNSKKKNKKTITVVPPKTTPTNPLEEIVSIDHVSFFSVIDGHAGDTVSQMLKTIFFSHLINEETRHIFDRPQSEINNDLITDAIKEACKKADEQIIEECKKKKDDSGACMVGLLLVYDHVFVWNVGDCRAITAKCLGSLCNQMAYKHEVEVLTFDHIAITERKRITKAGGWVENDRVFGILEPSRAFGDYDMKIEENKDIINTKMNSKQTDPKAKKCPNKKAQMRSVREYINRTRKYPPGSIISQPDIHYHDPNSKHHFFVLASDGIYDVLNNKRVVEFVEKKLFAHNNLNSGNFVLDEKFLNNVSHDLCLEALRLGSKDDLTAMIVVLC